MSPAALRRLAVVLLMGISFGGFYASSSLTGVSDSMLTAFNMSAAEYGFLSSIVGAPTIVLAFVFGWLIDRFGVKRCIAACAVAVVLGSATVALGCQLTSLPLLVTGRVVQGTGAPPLPAAPPRTFCVYTCVLWCWGVQYPGSLLSSCASSVHHLTLNPFRALLPRRSVLDTSLASSLLP